MSTKKNGMFRAAKYVFPNDGNESQPVSYLDLLRPRHVLRGGVHLFLPWRTRRHERSRTKIR